MPCTSSGSTSMAPSSMIALFSTSQHDGSWPKSGRERRGCLRWRRGQVFERWEVVCAQLPVHIVRNKQAAMRRTHDGIMIDGSMDRVMANEPRCRCEQGLWCQHCCSRCEGAAAKLGRCEPAETAPWGESKIGETNREHPEPRRASFDGRIEVADPRTEILGSRKGK
jgi:hypothetical protein